MPRQLHLDLSVTSVAQLRAQHERVLALGGRLLSDQENGPDEPFRVYADPAGGTPFLHLRRLRTSRGAPTAAVDGGAGCVTSRQASISFPRIRAVARRRSPLRWTDGRCRCAGRPAPGPA
ncbi:VOC family protein [Micromonospora sp. BQ11]|uniref:VOC family protein n=1 Tax=Micromonospora sp. BQ11 TaxID=3452212 RepID=UPI003F8A8A9C